MTFNKNLINFIKNENYPVLIGLSAVGLLSIWFLFTRKEKKKLLVKLKPEKNRLIFIDIETTGLSHVKGDKIVELACCSYANDETVSTFHHQINPERNIPEVTTKIHGITNDMVRDSPKFRDIALDFLEFIQDGILVGHNVKRFDIPFINSELKAHNTDPLSNDILDTMEIYRKLFPGQPAKLDDLCKKFGVDLSDRVNFGHGALLDTQLVAQCYKRMVENQNF